MSGLDTSSDDINVRHTGVYHHPFDIRAAIRLERDVAIRAVDDAAGIKLPTVVCHALDRRLVLARESYACKPAAIVERPRPDARHAVADR